MTNMGKTVELPLRVYEDLIRASEELSLMSKKPISVSMTVDFLIEIYRAHLSNPCALDRFSVQMRTSNFMSPEEFMHYWDEPQAHADTKHKAKAREVNNLK